MRISDWSSDVCSSDLVAVLLQVVRLGRGGVDEDRPGRGDRRRAAPEHRDVEGVEARLLQAQLGSDLAGGVHLRDAGAEEQVGGGEVGAVLLVDGQDRKSVAKGKGVYVRVGYGG